ncbi:cactin [Anaeramoeba flamelloides]|uniref:Splicing factor Cactin n=1 Tax=Anaeramoeba flamelloides TaxID=1746091 RepID=A0AAV8A7U2_9EUKA|nr:cactin [Anaeramoeba flamelloides]
MSKRTKEKKDKKKSRKRKTKFDESELNDEYIKELIKKQAEENEIQNLKRMRKEKIVGYTDEDNPFGDSKLTDSFVWKKRDAKKNFKSKEKKEEEEIKVLDELKKVREERKKRQIERELWEEQEAIMIRNESDLELKELKKSEDEFKKNQLWYRTRTRIKENREQPIDSIAKNIVFYNEFEIEIDEPYKVLKGMTTIEEFQRLINNINLFLKWDKEYNEIWQAMLLLTKEKAKRVMELNSESNTGFQQVVHSTFEKEIKTMLKGKSEKELIEMETEITQNLESNKTFGGTEFWEEVLKKLLVSKAKAFIKEEHEKRLKIQFEKLSKIEQVNEDSIEKNDEEEKEKEREKEKEKKKSKKERKKEKKRKKKEKKRKKKEQKMKEKEKEKEEEKEGNETILQKQQSVEQNIETELLKTMQAQLDILEKKTTTKKSMITNNLGFSLDLETDKQIGAEEEEEKDDLKTINNYNGGEDVQAINPYQMFNTLDDQNIKDQKLREQTFNGNETSKQFGDQEFNLGSVGYTEVASELGEKGVNLEQKEFYNFNDKYRPRKPKFYNRVKLGFNWNRYNRVHYSKENPPPKTVKGYKFNIFYPDLIEKSVSPTFKLYPTDSKEVILIKFSAGPPYEDIAFKILNRPWETNRRRAFRFTFVRGTLQLWFNFKKYFYRR